MGHTLRSDRSWELPLPPHRLWSAIGDVENYQQWWPWLHRFEPDGGLESGGRWGCTVAPPVPYVVNFDVVLVNVEAGRRAHARVEGDIVGDATLIVEPLPGGHSRARLRSRLQPANPWLRGVSAVAGPLARWGHDWVLDQGCRQFLERAGASSG